MSKKLELKKLFENEKVREELLRFNNSYFDFRSETVPFTEIAKIRKDLMVSSLSESRLSGIAALKYTISCGDENRTKIIEGFIRRFSINEIIRGAFKAVLFGFSPAIIEWGVFDGKFLPETLKFLTPRNWQLGNKFYGGKESGELIYTVGIETKIKASDYPFNIIPVFRNRDDLFVLGEGILEKLFWHVQYRNAGLDFWIKLVEKYGIPYILALYPDGSDDGIISRLKELVRRFVSGGWGVMPQGTDPKILEPHGKGVSSNIYRDLLTYCREDISMAILGHTGAAVSTAGKLGGDNTAMSVREDIALSDSIIIESFINVLIKKIIEINFGGGDCPVFAFYKENANKELAERDRILKDCGANFKKEYFVKTYSISDDLLADAPQIAVSAPNLISFNQKESENDSDARVDFFDKFLMFLMYSNVKGWSEK